jgi:hypothetical protein
VFLVAAEPHSGLFMYEGMPPVSVTVIDLYLFFPLSVCIISLGLVESKHEVCCLVMSLPLSEAELES